MQWQELRSHIRHLPARDITRIEKAFALGKKMHEGQKRRSGEPYFNHPIAVSHMLLDLKADADTIIAALLHDTVEDTTLTHAEIERDFGGTVATLIDGVTKLSSQDVEMSPKLDEQIETLRKIFTLMQQDVRIMVIKLVDRLHNMQTVEFLPPERQLLLAKETIEVFVKIADKLCMQDMRDELESLCLAVLEPETHAALLDIRNMNEQRGNVFMENICTNLRTYDRILGAKIDFSFEAKTWDQMKSQLQVGGSVATGVTFITVALICEDTDACYRTLGALHQLWKREVLSFQDFINEPRLNGYRGVHTTIIMQDGTRVRCKIRTREMHEYARSGITTKCFDSKALGIAEYLPWTKRLTSLTADTEGSSNDFWESLKSDILGESIVIHGPDDSIVQLPRGSTALDGAFYLFHEKALFIQSMKLNGLDVAFGSPLSNAASLNIVLAEHETYSREWLRFVHTGHAAATIRSALMKISEEEKLILGRDMLQHVFTDRKRGFIEEFDEKKLQKQLNLLGYATLNQVYISIADGRLEPQEIHAALFESSPRKKRMKIPLSVVQYAVNMDSIEMMDRVNLVHRKYGSDLADIRYHRRADDGMAKVALHVRMLPQELRALHHDLSVAGALLVTISKQSLSTIILIGCIVLLWGLDPVIAHTLLRRSVSPTDLVMIRFIIFFLAAAVTYIVHMFLSPVKAKPLSPLQPTLLASAGALFITAILSYLSLAETPATQYILLIIGGLMVSNMISEIRHGKLPLRYLLATIVIGMTLVLLCIQQGWSSIGLAAGVGAALGFAMYSQFSRRFQVTGDRIHARYPAFVFWLSVITIVLSLLLLPFNHILELPFDLVLEASAFALIFTFLPYVLYFECMRKTNADNIDRLLPFVCLITIAGETVFMQSSGILFDLPLVLLFLWLYKTDWSLQRHTS